MGWRACLVLVAVAVACKGADERNDDGPTSAATVVTTLDGSSSAPPTTTSQPTTGAKLDVQSSETEGDEVGDTERGCEKVDLLFVIDNSGSMADEQANLVASFPDFIAGMRTELADTDGYHVGVISSDVYTGDTSCLPLREGSLITETIAGTDASNQTCTPFASGARYMNEMDNLESRFACAAQIGTTGDGDERPMQTLLAALSSGQLGPGGCNEGFLRDDAILVITIITDEDDDHETDAEACMMTAQTGSGGGPGGWYDAVVAAKNGDEAAVVVLALVGPDEDPLCQPLDKCTNAIDGSEVGTRILDFTRRFTRGFEGSICRPYGPFFTEAISVIKSACDEFVPPG